MGGVGRLGVLAVESPDPVLSVVAPLGLAASVETALVIDLAGGVTIASEKTLSDLMETGPSRSDLSPGRSGVAMIPGYPLEIDRAVPLVERLADSWPAVVVRTDGGWPGPTVPVRPLFPGLLAETTESPSVWQPVGPASRPPGPGPVLPRLGGSLTRRLLSGRLPAGSRWVRSWRRVWEMPWA